MKSGPFLALLVVVAGCLSPAPSSPTAEGTGGDDVSGSLLDEDAGPAAARIPIDLIAADTVGVFWRINGTTGNATEVRLDYKQPETAFTSTIRWGRGADLYGAVVGASSAAILRIDLEKGTVREVASGTPLYRPFGLTALQDGRLLVADRGDGRFQEIGDRSVSADTPRIIEVDASSGAMRVLVAGPVFGGTSVVWMDIEADAKGNVYVVTGGSDHTLTTPNDPSDDSGVGALWRFDPADSSVGLVSSSAEFYYPEALTILPDGKIAVSEYSRGGSVHIVDPATGASRRVARISESGALWGIEDLPDGRLVVADNCSDPANLTEEECGPGGLWLVDPGTGAYELLVSDARFGALSHVRSW